MKIDKSLILCDERINGIKEEMAQFKDMEQAAKDAQSKLTQLLIQHYVEKTKEDLLGGLEFGDKVRVTVKPYDIWFANENPEVKVEEGYLNNVYVDRFYAMNYIKDYIRVSFNKLKKDGTKSLRTFDYAAYRIVKIEKI
jgi:predicted DNA-binding WGR domain protein